MGWLRSDRVRSVGLLGLAQVLSKRPVRKPSHRGKSWRCRVKSWVVASLLGVMQSLPKRADGGPGLAGKLLHLLVSQPT